MKNFANLDDNINGLEEICSFFKNNDIEYQYKDDIPGELNRKVYFSINGQKYHIVWFKNVSTLFIGESVLSFVPFKYIFLDTTFPIKGNCISFSYTRRNEYESLRIPISKQY